MISKVVHARSNNNICEQLRGLGFRRVRRLTYEFPTWDCFL